MTRQLRHEDTEDDPANLLLTRLRSFAPLSMREVSEARALLSGRRTHPPRAELYSAEVPCPALFILSGWGARQRILKDGRRQIVSILLPGELVGPALRPRLVSPCAGVAITPMETIDVSLLAERAHDVAPGFSGLVRAFHLLDRMEEVALRNQIVRLGRQTAYERLLNLLLELRHRLSATNPDVGDRFAMPLTQEVLADVLGLTVVHVNRTLQQARRNGLIEVRGGEVLLRDVAMVEAIADWHPTPALAD